jgi:hypothetical protein
MNDWEAVSSDSNRKIARSRSRTYFSFYLWEFDYLLYPTSDRFTLEHDESLRAAEAEPYPRAQLHILFTNN